MKKRFIVILIGILFLLTGCAPSSTYSGDKSVLKYTEWYLKNLVKTELKKVDTPEKIINACDIYEVHFEDSVNWPYICGREDFGKKDTYSLTKTAQKIQTLKNIKADKIIDTNGNPYIDEIVYKTIQVSFEVDNKKRENSLHMTIQVEDYKMTEMSFYLKGYENRFPGEIIEFFKCDIFG